MTIKEKKLVMEYCDFNDTCRGITHLIGNIEDETLYAEYTSTEDDGKTILYDTIELAVHVDEIIKIRDFCNKLIEAI